MDLSESLLAISRLSDICEIWEQWQPIAKQILPAGYDLRDASENVNNWYMDAAETADLEWVQWAIEELAADLSWRESTSLACCWWIDHTIKRLLQETP